MAVALSLTVGSFGVADFYMGRWGKGLLMLLLWPFFISPVIALVQGIYWLARGEAWFQHKYGDLEPVIALPSSPSHIGDTYASDFAPVENFTHAVREGAQSFLRAARRGNAAPPSSEGSWVPVPARETRYEALVRGELSLDEYLIEE